MEKKNSIGENMIINVGNSILSILFPVITFAYASRTILPDGVGRVNYAKSFSEIFLIFATLGINTYGIREAAKIRNNKEKLSIFVHEILIINLITTILSYIIYFLIVFFYPSTWQYRDVLIVYSNTIVFTTLGIEWLYSAVENYRFLALRKLIFQLASLAALFIFVKDKSDYVLYAIICVIANVGSNILNLAYARNYITFKNFHKYSVKKHLKPVFLLFGSTLANTIHCNIDTIMIGALVGPMAVGYYSAAIKINRMTRMLFSAASAVFLPTLSNLLVRNNKNDYQGIVYSGINLLMMLSLPASVGLFMLSDEILYIFCGTEFLPALPTMKLLTPIIFVTTITYALHNLVLVPNKREKSILKVTSISVIINVVLNYVLIINFEEFGAAIATLFTEILTMVLNLYIARSIISTKCLFKFLSHYFIGSFSVVVVIILIKTLITSYILRVIFGAALAIFCYFFTLRTMKNTYYLNYELKILSRIQKWGLWF